MGRGGEVFRGYPHEQEGRRSALTVAAVPASLQQEGRGAHQPAANAAKVSEHPWSASDASLGRGTAAA